MTGKFVLLTASICLLSAAASSQGTVYNLSPADDWYSVISGEGLQPGDEVVLAGGTYVTADDKMLNIAHVGTADQPIVIRAAEGQVPVITRNTYGAYNDYYVNLQHNVINMRGAQHVTLRGLEITGGNWAIRIGSKTTGAYISDALPMGNILRPARNITVEYCKIHHVHNTAISANFPGDVYDGLVFRHNDISRTARYGESFYLGNFSSTILAIAKNCVIESNYLHDQVYAGIWYVDPAFSDFHGTGVQFKDGSYNNITCPPGLSPVTFSPAAESCLAARKTKVQSWYLDMNMVRQYWGTERLYHHTAPINMLYGLHEALRIVLQEGLPARWQRHHDQHCQLKAGLEALGFAYLADPRHQLPMLNAVSLPPALDEAADRKRLLEEFNIEVGAGLGAFKGKAWRIGLMGESATPRHVSALLSALRKMLGR